MRLGCALALAAAMTVASAQPATGAGQPGAASASPGGERITPNFTDADIGKIAEAVAMITHKTIIMDPRVRAQVTVISSTPMSPDAFYQTFLNILQVHGFMAVPSGRNTIKIMPDANQRYMPGNDLPAHVSATSDQIVTEVIPVKNVSAAQLVPVLRPLIPPQGDLGAYPPSNILIISDRASNVNRIMRIVQRIDAANTSDVDVMTMQNASAVEVARIVSSLFQGQGQTAAGGTPLKIVADERSNSILLSGDKEDRLRASTLIAHLDTPLTTGGNTRVRYLHYEDAAKLAPKLEKQISGMAQSASGGKGSNAAQGGTDTQIWADEPNNALVITAPTKEMREINDIIDKLDIRRAQVLVEAIIVDVDLDKSAELGVNWATYSQGSTIPGATFLTPVGGASLVDLAGAIANPSTLPASGLVNGTTIALGRIAKSGLSFAAMLRALRSSDDSNVIATPSAVTLDHQEATIKIAQEVPFVTGQYTSGSTAAFGQVTPFETIQREEVGTILKITPQINGSDAIILKIEIESSSVVPKNAGPQGAVDLTTNKRTISTNVLIEDGGIIVLGGLISNEYDRTSNGVPFFSHIPLLGELFKDHTATHQKKNLMIFIRPQILRDGIDASIETNSKYNFIREQQRQVGESELLPLLPGANSPTLPPMQAPKRQAPAKPAPGAAPEHSHKGAQPAPAPHPAPEPQSKPQGSP